MDFVKASELKKLFSVSGHFYKLRVGERRLNCRSALEITSVRLPTGILSTSCAVVVMMNPGSSSPKDPNCIEREYLPHEVRSSSRMKEMIPTKPDLAQYQVMRLMLRQGWQHVRILNLSDLRNGNSTNFSSDFLDARNIDPTNPHCITDAGRLDELFRYCDKVQYIVAAWGRPKVLLDSALTFLNQIERLSGISVGYPWYYHASPSRYDYKIYWLENVQATIQKRVQLAVTNKNPKIDGEEKYDNYSYRASCYHNIRWIQRSDHWH